MIEFDDLRDKIAKALATFDLEPAHDAIRNRIPLERLELDPQEGPSDMDTLGSLIDKLITVDMKMWHNQEVLYKIRRMHLSEFASTYGHDLESLHQTIKRCCDLNVQRATLMDAIDKHFASVIAGKAAAEVREQFKTY